MEVLLEMALRGLGRGVVRWWGWCGWWGCVVGMVEMVGMVLWGWWFSGCAR